MDWQRPPRLLNHVIALNEAHVRRLGREFIAYYHEDRTHLGLDKDTPSERPIEGKPEGAELESLARVNPAFSWYKSLFGPTDLSKTLAAWPMVLQGSPFTTMGGLDNTWVQGRRASRLLLNDNLAWTLGAHELRFGTNIRIFRLNDDDSARERCRR